MDLCNINDIHALLSRHGFRFSKSLGQNFLVDASVPRDIAAVSGADADTGVLEIGPGVGCLTERLALVSGKVLSVELDRSLIPVLGETVARFSNVEVVQGDIMKTDIAALVKDKLPQDRRIVCANLPYNITTPVLAALVKAGCFESITVMIQKEVAMRICAEPGTSDYGAFTVFMQYYAEPELVFDVPPSCFIPQPKVTSAVIRCSVRKSPAVNVADEAFFFTVVRSAFALRRKTLLNCLSSAFGDRLSKGELAGIIEKCGFEPAVRGERLSLPEFARLSDTLLEVLSN